MRQKTGFTTFWPFDTLPPYVEENPVSFMRAAAIGGVQCDFYEPDAAAASSKHEQSLYGRGSAGEPPANNALGQHQAADHGRLAALYDAPDAADDKPLGRFASGAGDDEPDPLPL